MHTLWQHPNGNWYVLFGPRLRKQISTKTKDRGEAEGFLARFIAIEAEPDGLPTVGEILEGYRKYKVATTPEEIELVDELRALQKHAGALDIIQRGRLKELAIQIGHKVRSSGSLEYSVKGLKSLEQLYPTQLPPTEITKWAQGRGASAGTILRDVGVLRAAMAWAKASGWITEVPSVGNPVSTPSPRDRWLSRAEGTALIDGCQEPHIRVFAAMGLMTLARTGAILEAKWSLVNWERRLIDYGAGHGNKRRAIVPLNDEIFALLEGAFRLASTPYIIEWRGAPVTSIRTGFTAARERAGLGSDVTPHILRHSGASWLVEAGVPDAEVARMLGDTEEMVRTTYGHFSPAYLKRASSALKLRTA